MRRVLIFTLLLLCSACVQFGSDPQPMRYYLLQPNADAQPLTHVSTSNISLEPIEIPAYLDRPQLTTHNREHQVVIASLDRWAEPLEDNFTRVFKEDLARHLPNSRVDTHIWQENGTTDTVELTINSFDGILGERLSVDIRWSISRNGSTGQLRQGHFTDHTPVGDDYIALVAGLNQALDRFSEQLAIELGQLK